MMCVVGVGCLVLSVESCYQSLAGSSLIDVVCVGILQPF